MSYHDKQSEMKRQESGMTATKKERREEQRRDNRKRAYQIVDCVYDVVYASF